MKLPAEYRSGAAARSSCGVAGRPAARSSGSRIRSVRITRWVLGVAGALILLLVAAVIVATNVIDPNRYKRNIEAIVGDLTGSPFEIRGDLALTWYPWLGVRTGAAQLGNPPGLSGPPLIAWQALHVRAKLIPLLRGQVAVDRVRLQAPHIYLRRAADGRGNWEDLLGHFANTSGQRTRSSTGRPAPQVAGLEIRDGALEFVDDRSAVRLQLSDWQLDIGTWEEARPLTLSSRFITHGGSLPPVGVPVEIDVPRLTARSSPLSVAIPKLALRVAGARLDGGLAVEESAGRVHAGGPLSAEVPSLRDLIAVFGVEVPVPQDRGTLGPLTLTGTWAFDGGALALKPVEVRVDATTFAGWIERSAAAQPVWSFELHGDHIDLGRYVETETANRKPFELPVDALRALRAQGSLVFDRAQLAGAQMKDVRLRLELQ